MRLQTTGLCINSDGLLGRGSTVIQNGRDCIEIDGRGNVRINGRPPELLGADGRSPELDRLMDSSLLKMFVPQLGSSSSYLVKEGSDDGRVYKVGIGCFDKYRQERAWIAYKERVVTDHKLPKGSVVSTLQKAAKVLHQFDETEPLFVTDEGAQPAQLLAAADRLQSAANARFTYLLRNDPSRMLEIRDGHWRAELDPAVRTIHRAYRGLFEEALANKDFPLALSALKGFSGTDAGHQAAWKYIGLLMEAEKWDDAMQCLKDLSPTLRPTEQTERFAEALWMGSDARRRDQLIEELRQVGATGLCDSIKSTFAFCASKEGKVTEALALADSLENEEAKARCFPTVANALWEAGDRSGANNVISRLDSSSQKDEWLLSKADALWRLEEFYEARNLVSQVNSSSRQDTWNLEKAGDLWKRGEEAQAKQLISALHSSSKQDEWNHDKANELWCKGDQAGARNYISYLHSSSKQDGWNVDRANELWRKGDQAGARNYISYLHSSSKQDEWNVDRANDLWREGDQAGARNHIGNLHSNSKQDSWNLQKANDCWDRGDSAGAMNHISRVHSRSSQDGWYSNIADQLWHTGQREAARAMINRVSSSSSRNSWTRTHC